MSRLDSSVSKNGQVARIRRSSAKPSGCRSSHSVTAVPNPYQPGIRSRDWLQLKTQGIARRSSIRLEALRDAGRLPMLSSAIS